jgi:ADP-ribose pyrophosphatase
MSDLPGPDDDPPLGETIASGRGFDGVHVHVRVDRVRLPSGRIAIREVVEHPGSVAIVAVTRERQVLLLRQSHHAIQSTLLGLPAGTLGPKESPEACARRELEEETGYRPGQLTRLATYYVSPGYTDEQQALFRADNCEPAGGAIDPDELIHLVPVPLAEISGLVGTGLRQIADAKTLLGLLFLLQTGG